jgi:repressor LexA
MASADPRETLLARVAELPGESLARLSALIGRNPAYLQQYRRRGSPRVLPERERGTLARYLGLSEAALGGPDAPAAREGARVPWLDARAAGGAGGLAEDDRVVAAPVFDPAFLHRLGVRPGALALLDATGDSMAPTVCPGDTMLVDGADRRVTRRGGLYVLRLDGALLVKRVRREGARLVVTSDNPDAPPVPEGEPEVLGRVVWLGRSL